MTFYTKIKAIDFEVAKNTITNDDLTKILDTSDEWITTRTGIKERRIADSDESATTLALDACKKVIKKANIDPNELDLIIAATSTPEDVFPSVSCIIQGEIGATNAAAFDLRAACSGFIYSLNVAKGFIKSGIYKNILIVASDTTTKFTDREDRSTCVLFGDGAGAAIIGINDIDRDDIVEADLIADGKCGHFITLKKNSIVCPLVKNENKEEQSKEFINMKGRDVYKFVMQVIPPKIEELLKKCNMTVDDIDYFIPHQSNQRMIEGLSQRLNLSEDKIISNIKSYGNMSAASVPVAIKESIDSGKIKLPSTLLISAFGAGMTGANAIIRLEKN